MKKEGKNAYYKYKYICILKTSHIRPMSTLLCFARTPKQHLLILNQRCNHTVKIKEEKE